MREKKYDECHASRDSEHGIIRTGTHRQNRTSPTLVYSKVDLVFRIWSCSASLICPVSTASRISGIFSHPFAWITHGVVFVAVLYGRPSFPRTSEPADPGPNNEAQGVDATSIASVYYSLVKDYDNELRPTFHQQTANHTPQTILHSPKVDQPGHDLPYSVWNSTASWSIR